MEHSIRHLNGRIMVRGKAESFVKFVEENRLHLAEANLCNIDLSEADLSAAVEENDLMKKGSKRTGHAQHAASGEIEWKRTT